MCIQLNLVGIITLEDVIEELIGEEIVDETDQYVDVHRRIAVARATLATIRHSASEPVPTSSQKREKRQAGKRPSMMTMRSHSLPDTSSSANTPANTAPPTRQGSKASSLTNTVVQ